MNQKGLSEDGVQYIRGIPHMDSKIIPPMNFAVQLLLDQPIEDILSHPSISAI
jgi:hypothetical protein